MPRRPAISILLVTGQRLARADFDRAGGAPSLVAGKRPAIDDGVGLVEAAIRLSSTPLGKRAWVLSTDLSLQTVELPGGAAAGVGDEELRRALAFEAEALSNINAFEAQTGYTPIASDDGRGHYLVTSATRADLDLIDDIVTRSGGSLEGVAYPAALPRPVGGSGKGAWQRTELWSDAIVCVGAPGAKAPASALALHADPRSGAWISEIDAWSDAHGLPAEGAELLLSPDFDEALPAEGRTVIALADDGALGDWLGAWAAYLSAQGEAWPGLLRPAPKPMARERRFVIAAALALFAGAACAGHFMWTQQRIDTRSAELARLAEPVEALRQAEQQIEAQERRVAALLAELSGLESDLLTVERSLDVQGRRPAALLEALASNQPPGLVVDQIQADKGETLVRGRSVTPEAPNQLATGLGRSLGALAWSVEPPRKRGEGRLTNGGPWTFEIAIVPRSSAELSGGPVRASREGGTR